MAKNWSLESSTNWNVVGDVVTYNALISKIEK